MPPVAQGVAVSLRQPLSVGKAGLRLFALSPEWPDWRREIAGVDSRAAVVSVPVPEFTYWAMIVAAWPLIPADSPKPAENWFLPVQK